MTTCSRRIEWDAAHRVLRHESKCSTLHGHRYVAEIVARAEVLDDVDRVVDFGVLKARVGAWVDEHWDHTTLVNAADDALLELCEDDRERGKRAPYVFDGEPTAERIAAVLLERARALVDDERIKVVRVRVWETPNCWAEVEAT